MIKAVIFDMDGVIIDSEDIYLNSLLKFSQFKNPAVKREDIVETVGRTAEDTWSVIRLAIGTEESWESLRQEYRDNWRNYDEIDYRAIFRPAVKTVLEELKKRGYLLAVASSTQLPLVRRVLEENEILDYFQMVVSGNSFKKSKPDPEIYLYTAKQLGVSPEECFVLEDSTPGIQAGRSAGMTVAALIDDRFGFDRSLASMEVGSVEDILTYLPQMKERRERMLLIQGGKIADPVTREEYLADVAVKDGKIAAIIKGGTADTASYEQVIDASGLTVAPGLVDVHVHFRDPGLTYKEDIQTGAAAAKKGGFTTVVCMANTKPAVDNVETLQYVIEEGKKTGIHVLAAAAVSKGLQGRELTDMESLKAAGAAGFTDDGIPLMDESMLKLAMEKAAELQMPISLHEEDKTFIKDNGINHGAVSEKLGIFGSPAMAEDVLVARDCMIALHTGADVNIQHISSGNSVKMVGLAKELGAKVWAEVTPHHFALTEEAVLKHGALAKMNPPLRTEEDRQALIAGLKDGTIDMIATDHAPHSAEEKARPLAGDNPAPSGIIGLETALALGITCLVKEGHLTAAELMDKMSYQPARLYHLDCGRIEEGAPADLVIFSETESWQVKEFASRSSNSPFTGETLTGKVKYTICGGTVVYSDK